MQLAYTSDRTPQHRQAVILCCDKGFSNFAALVASQIHAMSPDADFDICICAEDASALAFPPSLDALPVRHCHLQIDTGIDTIPQSQRISIASYLRLFLPSIFEAEYDRILYLDCDVLISGGDIAALLAAKLCDGHVIGAVRTSHQRRNPAKHMQEFRALNLPASPYFNAGVMLIDVKKWHEHEVLQKCLAHIAQDPQAMFMHDQSALNLALIGKWSELSYVWNWLYSGRFSYLAEGLDPHIIHFAGAHKPWSRLNGEYPPKYAEIYRKFFFEHFPEVAANIAKPAPIFGQEKFHRKALFKQWLEFPALVRYMRRFDDPYIAIDPTRT